MVKIQDIIAVFEKAYPPKAAETWDNIGLQLGRREDSVEKILLCLEITMEVIEEAISESCNLIISHHPLIFKPLAHVSGDDPVSSMILTLARERINLYVAHTNCDAAPNAISSHLSQSLQLINSRPLIPKKLNPSYKLITYTPQEDAERVLNALHEAGAGCMGNYHHVSFRALGTGHFTSFESANPSIGKAGSREEVQEIRAELVVTENELKPVLRALHQHHPYEEIAYDLYKLENEINGADQGFGFGIVGDLANPMTLERFVSFLKKAWQLNSVRICGDLGKSVQKIAILNGSGAKFLTHALGAGADVYVTGDCTHHDFDGAKRLGLCLIDAGHYESEKYVVEIFEKLILENFETLSTIKSQQMKNPATEL